MNQSTACLAALAIALSLAAAPGARTPTLQSGVEGGIEAIDDQPLAADARLDALLLELEAPTDAASLPAPDLRTIRDGPLHHRDEAYRLSTGPARRVAERAFGIAGLSAWQFASPDIDEPILLLIHQPQGNAAPAARVSDITLTARFYRTALAAMRRPADGRAESLDESGDGGVRRILVFVGADPVYSPEIDESQRAWSGASAAVAAAILTLLLLRFMLARRRVRVARVSAAAAESEHWNDADLPAEPADALAELHRRSGDTISHER